MGSVVAIIIGIGKGNLYSDILIHGFGNSSPWSFALWLGACGGMILAWQQSMSWSIFSSKHQGNRQGQRRKRRLDLTVIFSFHSQLSKLSSRSILLTVLPPLNSTTQGPSRYTWASGNVSDLKDIRCNSTISSHAWQFVKDDPQDWPQLQFFCSIIIISCWMTSYFTISGLK